jgi:hypothetical protein
MVAAAAAGVIQVQKAEGLVDQGAAREVLHLIFFLEVQEILQPQAHHKEIMAEPLLLLGFSALVAGVALGV